MNRPSKYRTGAALVAALFLLFNVGLPIVVASCPMSDTLTPACGMCNENSAAQTITLAKNTSCCATVVAADKNSTEFVQLKAAVGEPGTLIMARPALFDPRDLLTGCVSGFIAFSPPLFTDIPIFTSSLLI